MSKPQYAPNLLVLVPSSARPSTQRLWIASNGAHSGLLDGAWWPRSHDAAAELPGLIMIIDGARGTVVRLVLAADGWDSHPRRLMMGGRLLLLDYFASQPASLLTAFCAGGDRVDLLVLPPETAPDKAHAAMTMIAVGSNRLTAPYRR
jgi:Family of unknown function (DUF5994)